MLKEGSLDKFETNFIVKDQQTFWPTFFIGLVGKALMINGRNQYRFSINGLSNKLSFMSVFLLKCWFNLVESKCL